MDEAGEDTAAASKKVADHVTHWLNEIAASRKREKDFRKEGQRIIDIYSGEKKNAIPFNILFSNTETLLPALYSSTPRPDVQRRFKDEDPLGKAGSQASNRLLEFLLDTNIDGYETFDEGVRMATLDGLLPGRGVACVKYDFEEGALPDSAPTAEDDPSGNKMPDGTPGGAEPTPYKKSELVCVDTRSWNRVFFGYAKKWSKVPWVAYEEHLDKSEAKRLFGAEITAKIEFTKGEETDNEEDKEGTDQDDRNTGERKTALVYQIWDKKTRKVLYVSPQYQEGYLLEQDDPLGLTGFFNTPRPLQFVEKSNDLMPVALYALYENQAKELNRITLRINRIVEAIKAKGIYDSELGDDIKNLVEADDNQLVPADKSSSLAAEKGLQNAIWYMPLDVLVGVLEKLYAAREQCKRVIYEVTGISDIIRGSTSASETATAQRIKSDWGTLRLKRLQKEVQRYARDLLRMMLDVASSKFSESTWAKMTGLPFLSTEQAAQLQQTIQTVQLQAAQMAQAGQQPTPQQMQQMQQLQAETQKPVWGKVLEMLRDDMQRAYRVDIETNSTVEPEAVEDQKKISEVMTALGQYLNGVTPLIVSGAMPFEAAQAMMLAIVRRFRFGVEIEDYIKQMKAPKPPDDGKGEQAQAAMQAQQKQMQDQVKSAQDKLQADAKIAQLESALKAAEEQNALISRKADLDVRELKVSVAEHQLKLDEQRALEKVQVKEQVFSVKNSAEQRVKSLQDSGAKREQQIAKQAGEKVEGSMDQVMQTVSTLESQLEAIAQRVEGIGNREIVGMQKIKGANGKLSSVRRSHADGTFSEVTVQ